MMKTYYEKKRGDRRDGWKLRDVPLFFKVVPFVMRTRLDTQNYYEETLDVEPMMEFLRAHKDDMPNVTMMTIFVAAMVRMISQRPALNRFVVHNILYAHISIEISIAIKRSMSDDGEETMIKPSFDPRDTLLDVQKRLETCIAEAMDHGDKDVDRMRREYRKRRDFLVPALNELGLKTVMPKGAFYIFSDIRSTGLTDEEFALKLLKEFGVAVVPGSAFGACGAGFVRMSYATSLEKIKLAVERISNMLR